MMTVVDGAGVIVERHHLTEPGVTAAEQGLRAEGLTPQAWSNGPGFEYGWHAHGYDKVLYCVSGSIVFHIAAGEAPGANVNLGPGDRLELVAGVEHAATVGPDGVRCVEASR